MDNFTHTMVGWSLARASLEKKSPLAFPVLLIAVNLPDAEVIGTLFGRDYLASHRGIMHAPLGVAGLSFALAGAFWAFGRWSHNPRWKGAPFWPLWLLSIIGLATHPVLDWLNDYGIRPLLPFSSQKYYGDLLTLFDPWCWLALGSGLFVMAQSARSRALWGILSALMLVAVIYGWSPLTGLLWAAVLAVAIGIGILLRHAAINAARVALVAAVLYVSGIAICRDFVLRAARSAGPAMVSERINSIDVLPGRPASYRRWTVVMQSAQRYYIADVGLRDWHRYPPQFRIYEKNLRDPYFLKALEQHQIAVMAEFARFPAVTVNATPQGHVVVIRDLRYARAAANGWGVASAVLP